MASQYVKLPVTSGGGGGGAVDSFNGRTGVVVSQAGDYSAGIVSNTPAGNISATNVQSAINELDSEKQETISGSDAKIIAKQADGSVSSYEPLAINSFDGLSHSTQNTAEDGQSYTINQFTSNLVPLENSPDFNYNINYAQINIDPNLDNQAIGTDGNLVTVHGTNINANGNSDLGALTFYSNNMDIGNGTDSMTVKGTSYMFGFGTARTGVTFNGPLQGYGFQPSLEAGVVLDNNAYISSFYDYANIATEIPSYTSYSAGPNIDSIRSNNSYSGMTISPNIDLINTNASVTGINVYGNLDVFDENSFYHGINISPNINLARSATGININMDNVVPYAGAVSSLVIQDLTISFNTVGDNNTFQIEYLNDATAGSETASLAGQLITVHMESGVSTATQIKAAIDADFTLASNLSVVISGVASNAQVSQAATNFANGEYAGNVKAAYLDGDVEITGSLTFGGALSIGKLNAFASQAVVDGGGAPATIHGLITNPTVAANATIVNADTIGVNTAMLLAIGDNATVTSAFLGLAALALPAVVSMGSGATIDRVAGAVFAVNLDVGATGGTIDTLDLCRALAIPNGATTVTNMYGYKFDLPFGDPGTTTWGFYESVGVHNYLQGDLLIGGTAGSVDVVSNSSVALEISSTTKALLNARMNTTERDALTAINGMQIYNTTTDKLQVYAAGSWVDLH